MKNKNFVLITSFLTSRILNIDIESRYIISNISYVKLSEFLLNKNFRQNKIFLNVATIVAASYIAKEKLSQDSKSLLLDADTALKVPEILYLHQELSIYLEDFDLNNYVNSKQVRIATGISLLWSLGMLSEEELCVISCLHKITDVKKEIKHYKISGNIQGAIKMIQFMLQGNRYNDNK